MLRSKETLEFGCSLKSYDFVAIIVSVVGVFSVCFIEGIRKDMTVVTNLIPRAIDVIEKGLLVSERDTRGKPSWKKMLYMGAYYELERSVNGWKIVKTTPIAGVVQSQQPQSIKKTYGCPYCYKKTYTTYELGEKCDVCDEVIGTTYYYQSKARFENGKGIWIRCKEEECLQMASKDYKVKKVVL